MKKNHPLDNFINDISDATLLNIYVDLDSSENGFYTRITEEIGRRGLDVNANKPALKMDEASLAWRVFKDRTESLLRRWDKFAEKENGRPIQHFLIELEDEYTAELLKKENPGDQL